MRQAVQVVRNGGLIALPTDSSWALAGHTGDADVLERIRRIRGVDDRHQFTLLVRDLSEIATYARVDNVQYRTLKANTPGPYTFILEGSRELPRRVLHPKRKTIGVRVPSHPAVAAILDELNEPLLSSTLILSGDEEPLSDPEEICARLQKQVDIVIDCGGSGHGVTTVIDLTSDEPKLVRRGMGDVSRFGFSD